MNMADKITSNERGKKQRLADSTLVCHDERTVMDSPQYPESQLTNHSHELTADRSTDLDTVSSVSPTTGEPSGSLLSRQDSRTEMFQPANSSLSGDYDTTNTIQAEAVENKQQPNNDDVLLSSIDMRDPGQTVWLLISENAFTQDGLDQALLSACSRGHKLLVQTLVQVGANIEHRDRHGNTPLLICAENGFTDIVRFLVSRHANINAVNSVGNTALILSVRPAGSTDLTRFLVEQQDVDIYHENQHGHTALMRAQEAMDVDTILILLEKVMKRPTISKYVRNIQDTQIMNASSHGLHKVCILLEEHLRTGISPLRLAIQKRDITSFQILLDCQFSSGFVKKQYINKALLYLFRKCRKTQKQTFCPEEVIMIQELLEYGADVSQCQDVRPLLVAVEYGDLDVVELLCKHGALKYEYSYVGKHDTLMIAARDGRPDLIEMLLKYGYKADINGYCFTKSPLNCALEHDHTECAKVLIQHGAKMDVISALLTAVSHPRSYYMNFLLENYTKEMLEYLSDSSYRGDGLLIAVLQKGCTELVHRFLNPGVIANQLEAPGGSQIMASTTEGVAQLCIQEGSGVNDTLDTPLIQVISSRQCRDNSTIQLAQLMVQYGASVNCRSGSGKTPLMVAASKADCADMLEMLIDNGADVNGKDNEGNTALIHAMVGGYWENPIFIIHVAVDKTRLINSQNKEGLTALMVAVSHGYTLMALALLTESADVNMTDSKGNSALHHLLLGSSSRSEKLLQGLINAGADVNHQNNDGLSPLMLAARESMACAVSTLLNAGALVNVVSKLDHASTALSYLPASLNINVNTVSCLEALLDRGASVRYLNPLFLHTCIIQRLTVIPKLIQHGLRPTDIESHKLPLGIFKTGPLQSMSPFCVALLVGHVSLARYFVDIQFLTLTDVSIFASNSTLEGLLKTDNLVDSVRFLQEIFSQPMSLVCLSRVPASSTSGFCPEREDLLNSLPLLQEIQD